MGESYGRCAIAVSGGDRFVSDQISYKSMRYCTIERDPEGRNLCGPTGKLFEPKNAAQ